MKPWTEKDRDVEINLQRKCDRFVSMNVHHCASMIVDHLLQTDADAREWFDEAICEQGGLECPDCGEVYSRDSEHGTIEDKDGNRIYTEDPDRDDIEQVTLEEEDPSPCCNVALGPQTLDVLEWWIVDSWFAERLRERGCLVIDDFYGLTVWGRETSGQAIAMDGVVREIVTELHREHVTA